MRARARAVRRSCVRDRVVERRPRRRLTRVSRRSGPDDPPFPTGGYAASGHGVRSGRDADDGAGDETREAIYVRGRAHGEGRT